MPGHVTSKRTKLKQLDLLSFLEDFSSLMHHSLMLSPALLDSLFVTGDKLYPVNTAGETGEVGKSTDAQLKDPSEDSALHRIVVSDPYTTNLQVTITPKYKHLLPVVEPPLSHDSKSQL